MELERSPAQVLDLARLPEMSVGDEADPRRAAQADPSTALLAVRALRPRMAARTVRAVAAVLWTLTVMALLFDHRAIAWSSGDAAGTNYVQSDLSFQPVAQLFVTNGMSSATDAASASTNAQICIGLASSTSNRGCMGLLNVDNAAAADTQEIYRNDAVAASVSAAGAMDGLLDVSAYASNGYTLTVDDQIPASITVFALSWGGDVQAAEVIHFVESGATGNVDYTLAGAFKGDAVFLVGCQLTGAAPTAAVADSGIMLGFATGPSHQYVLVTNSDEGSTNADVDVYQRGDECLAMITVAGGNPNARASFVQWNSDGFRLNWIARAVTNRRYMAMVIRGGYWRAGTVTINLQATNNTATVSGLPFTPVGAVNVTHSGVQQAAGTAAAGGLFMTGCFSSTASRRAMSYSETDGAGNMAIDVSIDYDAFFVASNAGANVLAVDVSAVNSDGFTANVDLGNAGASATSFHGYLAFGNAVSPPAGSLTLTGHAPTVVEAQAGITIEPGVGALQATGQTPALAFGLAMTAGAAALTGQAPVALINHPVPMTAGAVTLEGQAPTLAFTGATSIDIPAGSFDATGLAPVLAYTMPVAAGNLTATGTTTVLADTLEVPAGVVTLTGLAPTLAKALEVPAGQITLTGLAPALDRTLAVPAGALALTGAAPALLVGSAIQVPAGSLALTGEAATLAYGLEVPAGSIALVGTTTAELFGLDLPSGAVTLTGLAPSLVGEGAVAVPAGSLTLTGTTPTFGLGLGLPAGSLTLSGLAPAVSVTVAATPTAGVVTLTGLAPSMAFGLAVPAGAIAATGAAPSLNLTVPIPAGQVTTTGLAPTLFQDHPVQIPAGAIALAGQTSTQDFGLPMTAGALTLTGQTPQVTGAGAIGMPAGALTLTGLAPSLAFTLPIPAGEVTLTGLAPARLVDQPRAMQVGALALTGTTSTMAFGLPVPAGLVTLTGQAPALTGEGAIAIPAGSLALTGLAPSLRLGVAVPSGTLALTGLAPGFSWAVAFPSGSVALVGRTPTVAGGTQLQVPAGSITLEGAAPLLVPGLVALLPSGEIALVGQAAGLGLGVAMPVGVVTLDGWALEIAAILDPYTTDPNRIVVVPAVDRVFAVPAVGRTFWVPGADRIFVVRPPV